MINHVMLQIILIYCVLLIVVWGLSIRLAYEKQVKAHETMMKSEQQKKGNPFLF